MRYVEAFHEAGICRMKDQEVTIASEVCLALSRCLSHLINPIAEAADLIGFLYGERLLPILPAQFLSRIAMLQDRFNDAKGYNSAECQPGLRYPEEVQC